MSVYFLFRDSLNLLPGKLSALAKNLCQGLGPKGKGVDYTLTLGIGLDDLTSLPEDGQGNQAKVCKQFRLVVQMYKGFIGG